MTMLIRSLRFAEAPVIVPGADRVMDFVASTDSVDVYNTVIEQDWDVTSKFSPGILFEHADVLSSDPVARIPIATAKNTRVEGGKLRTQALFPTVGDDPISDRVWNGLKDGRIGGMSVRLDKPREVIEEQRDGKTVLRLRGNTLVNLSIAVRPANPDAVAELSMLRSIIQTIAGTPANPSGENMSLLVTLAALLGMPATSTEAEVTTAVTELAGIRSAVTGHLPNVRTANDIRSLLPALVAAEAEVTTLRATVREREVTELIRSAMTPNAQGHVRMTEAERLGWLRAAGANEAGVGADPVKLKSFVDLLPVRSNITVGVPGGPPPVHQTPAGGSVAVLTPQQAAAAAAFGIKPEDYAASLR